MASTKLSEAARQLTYRAVYLKIYPRPSLTESRELLRVLQGYGEISMYRNLAYDFPSPAPNTIIAIFKHADSASRLIKASPLKFTLGTLTDLGEIDASAQLPFFRPQSPPHLNSSPKDSTAARSKPREFRMNADISTKDHQGYIARQHYYTGFRVKARSGPANDLKLSVPLRGLRQFSKFDPEKPQRYVKAERDKIAARKTLRQLREEGTQTGSSIPPEVLESKPMMASTGGTDKAD